MTNPKFRQVNWTKALHKISLKSLRRFQILKFLQPVFLRIYDVSSLFGFKALDQKQQPKCFLRNSCSENIRRIFRKISAMESKKTIKKLQKELKIIALCSRCFAGNFLKIYCQTRGIYNLTHFRSNPLYWVTSILAST